MPWRAPLDVVVWGATGFTGRLACAYLARDASKFFSFQLGEAGPGRKVRWGVAGRNADKVRRVLQECRAPDDTEVFVVEASDEAAIRKMVESTKVVCSLAGPFVKYSDKVVEMCAQTGTHYVDICGEPVWVRSCKDRHDDRARATGACIVNFCGYDSIPSDLGCLYAVRALRNKVGDASAHVRAVRMYQVMYTDGQQGFSGGSLQTGLVDKGNPKLKLTAGVDPDSPFLLGGETPEGIRDIDQFQTAAKYSEELGFWTAPFGMEHINAVAVRRSAGALGYGRLFNYQEVVVAPSEKDAKKMARRAVDPVPPEVIRKMIEAGRLPKPGEGPLPKHRRRMAFLSLLSAEAEDGTKAYVAVRGGEAGYEETAKMVVESALALAMQPADCPGTSTGGFLSTAQCMGSVLIDRLRAAGIDFYHVDEMQNELFNFWQMCQQRQDSSRL